MERVVRKIDETITQGTQKASELLEDGTMEASRGAEQLTKDIAAFSPLGQLLSVGEDHVSDREQEVEELVSHLKTPEQEDDEYWQYPKALRKYM